MLYPVAGHPLLSPKFAGLEDEDKRDAYNDLAEALLGLTAPAYTDPVDVAQLTMAVAVQVTFLLQQDVEPDVLESISNSHPGTVTRYRDRYRSSRAWSVVEQVTGVQAVRFSPPGHGV